MDRFGAGKKSDFMVHHLGAGFSKETFYWLLQHKGRSQYKLCYKVIQDLLLDTHKFIQYTNYVSICKDTQF